MMWRCNKRPISAAIAALGGLVAASVGTPCPTRADEVLDWNTVGLAATEAGGQNAAVASRTMAMMHLAVHDALNAIERRYEACLHNVGAEVSADPSAAIVTAARDVLVGVIPSWGKPEQRAKALNSVETAHAAALAKIPGGPPKMRGIVAGQAAAVAMLAARKPDNSNAPSQYAFQTAPGKWRPHPNPVPANPPIADPALAGGSWPAIIPQWGQVVPFLLVAPWQFHLPGPPALTSTQYAKDLDEVKRFGSKSSSERTTEQSEIARFWYEGSPQAWSRIARGVATERGLDRWDNARLLALVNTVIADGFIAGFHMRYIHDFWRPLTAIREAQADGNDATVADPAWETFLNTPPIPEYPSTHSISGGAASIVLARVFGSDQVAFKSTSGPPFAGITRTFTSFSQAAQENADSRIYAGVHFRTACNDGTTLGEQIGRRAVAQHLQVYRK
jgi:PAP2 superfamily